MTITATDNSGTIWTWVQEPCSEFPHYAVEHFAVSETGETRHLNWSRFQSYTSEHFALFVAARLPKRLATWTPEDIESLRTLLPRVA